MLIVLSILSLVTLALAALLIIALMALGTNEKRHQTETADLQVKLKATEEIACQYAAAYKQAQTSLLGLPTPNDKTSWH